MSETALLVPGAGVCRYLRPVVTRCRERGLVVRLLEAPAEPGVPVDLAAYGRALAAQLTPVRPVALAGVSVGAQVAAVAAAVAPEGGVRRLVLVGPTVDPRHRSGPRLLARWLAAGSREPPRLLAEQLPDWRRAGPRRLTRMLRSALEVRVEAALPDVHVPLHVVHGEDDLVCTHTYAARLAAGHGGTLHVVPAATHSWPYGDGDRFADLLVDIAG